MNNFFISILYRKIFIVLLVFGLSMYVFYDYVSKQQVVSQLIQLFSNNQSYKILLIVVFFFFFTFCVFNFFKEIKQEDDIQYQLNHLYLQHNKELEDLYNVVLSRNVIESKFYHSIRNSCELFWEVRDYENYHKYINLTKDTLRYIARLQDADAVVNWKEERIFLCKMMELVRLSKDRRNYNIDFFDPKANYRFPAGLFIIPLFNAIEYTFQNKGSSLRVDCFNVSGLWNCQISNYVLPTSRPISHFKYHGFLYLKERIHRGNWAIRLEKIPVEYGMTVVIVGKYAS